MKSACSAKNRLHNETMTTTQSPKDESNQQDRASADTAPQHGRKIGYVRVSTADQTEALQVDALEAAGCDVIYGDLGVSGAIRHRASLDSLLTDLGPGDVLVVWKLDRLSRSVLHLLQILDDLRQNGVDFIAVTQGIDTTTAVGRMLFGHLAVFAEFEREQIRERTKAGMAAAKARGVHVGRPRAIPPDVARILKERLHTGAACLEEMADELNVSLQTVARAIAEVRSDAQYKIEQTS